MDIVHIRSVDELRQAAFAWDDLWWRSEVTVPTLRAELIAQWVEQFAPEARFHAVVVQDAGRFVAALPLVQQTMRGFLRVGGLPTCPWSPSGDLLLDGEADGAPILDKLVSTLPRLPWKLLWLDAALLESRHWQMFIEALRRAQLPLATSERFRVAWMPTTEDWETFRRKISKTTRRTLEKSIRRLEEQGELRLQVVSPTADDDVEELMQLGFEVEDRSWKGEEGSSILRSPGMAEFYLRQAKQVAEWGQLELTFLKLNDTPIAYEYGWKAKDVIHSFKIGYDQQFAQYGPGQVRLYMALQRCCEEGNYLGMDCLGPLQEAARRLKPESYGVGRLVIATRGLVSRALLFGYQHVWPRIAGRRGETVAEVESAKRGAMSTAT